jgi:REP element-mobilizing transposase RayT
MQDLNRVFCVDFLAYAVMANHWHCVIRTRPDEAEALSDEQVVRRWMQVFPKRRSGTAKQIKLVIDLEVKQTLSKPGRVAELRERLSSVSWFMKSMNEYIARRSNHEEGLKGRFWEGRFKCQRLLDDASILACMAYVDLNPVRARIAESLEESAFTSAFDRVASAKARERESKLKSVDRARASAKQLAELEANARAKARAAWLVDLDGPERPVWRLGEKSYLRLVDLTGRRIRSDKRGSIPAEIVPVLESLDIDADVWVANVENYGKLFYRMAGKVDELIQAAKEAGLSWFKGRCGSDKLFKQPSTSAP